MLSHEDEQRLAAIERQLLIDDPVFARRLGRPTCAKSMCLQALAAVIGTLCGLAACLGALPCSKCRKCPPMESSCVCTSIRRPLLA